MQKPKIIYVPSGNWTPFSRGKGQQKNQSTIRSYTLQLHWIERLDRIDFKIMKNLCTVQEFGTFCFQFPFFFEISQCTNTANILLCNKMHLKWTYKVFFHVPLQKNINWFPLRGDPCYYLYKWVWVSIILFTLQNSLKA